MKKQIFIAAIIALFCSCAAAPLCAQSSFPRLTDRSKAGILSYLNTVIRDSMILVGQYCGVGSNTAQGYRDYVEELHRLTGKYPALLSVEYGFTPGNDLQAINQYAIGHWHRGGLVTISWHADNPWVDGYDAYWNTIEHKDSIHLDALLKNAPSSAAKTSYRRELMKVGRALRQLQDSGVVVLWRPFHEMNGTWFWWGVNDLKAPTNKEAFRLLWKDMYETFTRDLGLHNLIWVYGANIYSPAWEAPIDAMYPGAGYVDVVGTDIYSKAPVFDDYDELKKFNKVIAVCEIGPSKESYGVYDEEQIIRTFRGKAAWFLQWSSWKNARVAIKDNLHYDEMMHDPSVITLDRL